MTDIQAKSAALIATAYAAVFDDSLWPAWTTDLMHALDGSGGTFFVINRDTAQPHRVIPIHKAAQPRQNHARHCGPPDPLIRLILRTDSPLVAVKGDYLNERDPSMAEYMRWMRRVSGYDEHIVAITPLTGTAFSGGVAIHREVGAGPFGQQAKAGLSGVFQQTSHALQLGFTHARMLDDAYWAGLSASNDPEPAFLIDEAGAIMHRNDAAAVLVGARDGLALQHDRLSSPCPDSMARLNQAITRAIDRENPQSGAILLNRPSGKRAYAAVIHPLPGRWRWLAPLQAAAFLKVTDLTISHRRLSSARELYHLSPRENELTALIWEGHSPESAAACLGISLATCRSHLRHIMNKLGVSKQTELIGTLARLP